MFVPWGMTPEICMTRDARIGMYEIGGLLTFVSGMEMARQYCPLCGKTEGGDEHWDSHEEEAEEYAYYHNVFVILTEEEEDFYDDE